jgi:serine/threonine protein kinase
MMTTHTDIISSFTTIIDATLRRDAATHLLKLFDEGYSIDVAAVRALYDGERDITVSTELKRLLNKLEIAKRLPTDPTVRYDRKLTADEESRLSAEIDRLRNLYDRVREEKGAFDRKYQIFEEIGRGGMARIMRGVRRPDNQPVVFKYLLLEALSKDAARDGLIARFKREGKLCTERLNHLNVIKGHEYGEADGEHFIVLEYVEGGSLEDRIKKGPFDPVTFRDVTLQLCDAVEYMHSQDVIHRDIKPENILFTNHDTYSLKLADFGLARDKRDPTLSKLSFHAGTDNYVSPQQWKDARDADERDDIFSMGRTFREMLEGTRLVDAASYDETKVFDPFLRDGLNTIIKKCVAPEKGDRFQSVSTLRKALKDIFDRRRV